MLPGEIEGTGEPVPCFDCDRLMPLAVQRSAAGFYLGYFCPQCGPWSRESGYFATREEAEKALANPSAYFRT